MAKIGLVVRSGVDEAVTLGKQLLAWASKNGHQVECEIETAEAFGLGPGVSNEVLARNCNPIVALGGDGTLIGVGRYVEGTPPIMLGVNFGRLGFLTEVAPSELFSALETALGGTASFGRRNILYTEVVRDDSVVFCRQAVNDTVIHKGATDKLVELDFSVDEEQVTRFRCDGLIISTPTGSTAYNLSAGGPIVHPTLGVCIVTPICSHSLTHRPLVLNLESNLSVTVPEYDGNIILSIDGQEGFDLEPGDKINITKSKNSVIFVRSPSKSYFRILREKLSWGGSST